MCKNQIHLGGVDTLQSLQSKVKQLQAEIKEAQGRNLLLSARVETRKEHIKQLRGQLKQSGINFKFLFDRLDAMHAIFDLPADIWQNKMIAVRQRAEQLQAEIKAKDETLRDIRARVRGIKYHHTHPKGSRHGNTTNICIDIESRIEQALNKEVVE